MIYDSLGTTGVGQGPVAARIGLRPNSPNPFVGRTSIGFDLPRSGRVSLRVYDVSGRLVRTLADQTMEAGYHAMDWDGRDDGGASLQAGLYFCRLESAAGTDMRRMARVK